MSFKDFEFHPAIFAGITASGFSRPTPIQQQAIPPILSGGDLLGLAQTGTGKTAAFVLPLLQRLMKGPRKKTRALILAPTRELAEQIHENITTFAKDTGLKSVAVYGGVGKQQQIAKIRSGAEILVACPGRLLDLLNDRFFNLKSVETLVLDEADHMFDQGFLPDVRRIIKQVPTVRQSLVFSATMPDQIRHLAEETLNNPAKVQINYKVAAPTITHTLIQVAKEKKTALLKTLMQEWDMSSTLIFTRTKHKAKNLALQLQRAGCKAISLQGNMSQQKRQSAMDGFKDGRHKILVATDIAARGIDVENISHVINYDAPDTAEAYTHRTGRTGRAEKKGKAFTFAAQDDGKKIALIERHLGSKMVCEKPAGLEHIESEPAPQKQHRPAPQHGRKSQNTTAKTSHKSQRSSASSFDFGFKRKSA